MVKLAKVVVAMAMTVLATGLSGCLSLFPPKLAPLIPEPVAPAQEQELIEVELAFGSETPPDVVQLDYHKIRKGSSVVINVPSGLFEDRSEQTAGKQDFKTKDFFNEAEQQIEKGFINHQFRVLSRSKFEAKLRDLRDEARCDLSDIRCLRSKVEPEVRVILDDLEKKYENKEISALEYTEQIRLFKDKLQTASAGRTRSAQEKELTDISEVIRAAQTGDIRADYILQINVFDTKKKLQATHDLRHDASVRDFMRKNADVKRTFENGKNFISCAIVGSELNAKLIHVDTGEIVWIGEHELDEFSSGIEKVTVELGQRTYVTNESEVAAFVSRQNTPYYRELRYGKNVGLPEWNYRTELIGPDISSGRCRQNWSSDDETRKQLAKKVAKQLISNIKVL